MFYYKAEYEPCAMIQWIALVMMCLGSGTALLNIRDGNVALSDSVNYDAASNSWTLGFNKVPAYTSILPQLCNKTAIEDCPLILQTIHDCQSLHRLLHDQDWKMSSHLIYDANFCPTLTNTNIDTSVDQLVYITHPPSLRIINHPAKLNAWAASVTNTTYVFFVRVLFIKTYESNLYQVHHVTQSVTLQAVDIPPGLFALQHECRTRGLTPPRLAVLQTVIDSLGVHNCIWRCPLSHLRQPFNAPPPLVEESNFTNKLCEPLPESFTAVSFEFNVYMQTSTTGPPVLTQQFYDNINRLADEMRAEAETDLGRIIVVLTVDGSVYAETPVEELLLAHTIHKQQFENYESINIQASTQRRLLSASVVNGVTWQTVEGVLIMTDTKEDEVQALNNDVQEVTTSSLQTFTFDEELQVEGVDEVVRVESIQRLLPVEVPVSVSVEASHETAFYLILFACAVIITGKTCLLRWNRKRAR